ncbi:MAG: hypothetical protein K1X64_12115 [Myxococcaceae bacterium]|nr:hypothetical protein [Myxococcaceae bacterium]
MRGPLAHAPRRLFFGVWLALSSLVFPASAQEQLPADLELALRALQDNERERLTRQIGSVEELPFYRAELKVDLAEKIVTGTLRIRYAVRLRSVHGLWLYVQANAADGTHVELSQAVRDNKAAIVEQPSPTLYRVTLNPPVAATQSVDVELQLRAPLPDAEGGPYGYSEQLISLAGLLPVVCTDTEQSELVDESNGVGEGLPRRVGNWLISVQVPAGWKAFGPQETVGEVPAADSGTRYVFTGAAARDFPLVLTRGYQTLTMQVGNVTLESHFLPADARAGGEVLRHAAAALAEFEKRLGPLPWRRLKVVSMPLNNGHQGFGFSGLMPLPRSLYTGPVDPLVALGVSDVSIPPLLREEWSDIGPASRYTLAFAAAHQVAHQYFGALVGNDVYETPVVDEALAQAMALRFLEWKHGRKHAEAMKKAQWVRIYQLFRWGGGNDDAANRPSSQFDSSLEYTALTFGKAPFLYDEARKRMGDGALGRALKRYVDDYAHLQASADTLLQMLSAEAPAQAQALEQLQTRFWNQAHGDEDLDPAKMNPPAPSSTQRK